MVGPPPVVDLSPARFPTADPPPPLSPVLPCRRCLLWRSRSSPVRARCPRGRIWTKGRLTPFFFHFSPFLPFCFADVMYGSVSSVLTETEPN